MASSALAARPIAPSDKAAGAQLIERARALGPRLAERQAETHRRRQILPTTIEDFRQAGFFKAVQAERWGGIRVPHAAVAQVVRELARACPSSAWVYGVLATHSQILSAFPEEAQHDVWGADSSVLIASSFRAAPVDEVAGGILLSGDWPFSSGSLHSGWVMLGAVSPARGACAVLVPMSDVQMLDDWHVLGLRGTGSNSVRLDKVFVPEHRIVPYCVIYAPSRHNPGRPDSFWDNHPLATFSLYNFCCVVAGIAERALEVALVDLRGGTGLSKAKLQQESVHMRLAEAAADIEMASAAMINDCRELDERWERCDPFTLGAQLKQRRDICVLVQRLRAAVEKLTTLNNVWIYDTSPLQQLLRDITVASAHRSSNPEGNMLPYAKFIIEQGEDR